MLATITHFITSLLSIGVMTTLLGSGLRYMFSSHYRFRTNQEKFKTRQEAICTYVKDIYLPYKTESQETESPHPVILQAATNTTFATDKYDYRLIFLLLDCQIPNIELRAKDIDSAWPFLQVNYTEQSADLRTGFGLSKASIRMINKLCLELYLLGSILLFLCYVFRNFLVSHNVDLASLIAVIILFMLLLVCIGRKTTTVKILEKMMNKE